MPRPRPQRAATARREKVQSPIGEQSSLGQDRQVKHLWAETKIGNILPWGDIEDEAERLLENDQASRQAPDDDHIDEEQKDDQEVEQDETDPYNEVIFGRRRPDSVAADWTNKVLYVLEFKRTSDQRHNYRERGESRARAQHNVLVKSLEKVAGEAEGERAEDGRLNC